MVDIQSTTAEIRRGKKKDRKKIEITGQKYNGVPYSLARAAIISAKSKMMSLRLVIGLHRIVIQMLWYSSPQLCRSTMSVVSVSRQRWSVCRGFDGVLSLCRLI